MAKRLSSVLILALAACSSARQGMEGHLDVVAQVDGFRLTTDHAAELLAAGNEQIAPTVPRIADPLTDLWVNYTLLASQLASPTALNEVDISWIAERELQQALVWNLHKDVILARAQMPEGMAEAAYEEEQPRTSVEARHIVVRVPETATQADADSLRRYAESIRRQLLDGADFAEMAERHSQDPASAPAGGTLGWIQRGRLVAELEDVVFALETGEISDLVRSAAGYHIVQVTGRREPEFQSAITQFTAELEGRKLAAAESTYIDSLFARADTRYTVGAAARMKRLAADPRVERLTPLERSAPLASFDGGFVTVGDLADYIVRGAPNSRSLIAGANEQGLISILNEMIRSELLVKAANDLGYSISEQEIASIEDKARRLLYAAVTVSGFTREELTDDDAIMEVVDRVIIQILNGERSAKGVERVYLVLRQDHTIQVYPDRFPLVYQKLVALREGAAGDGEDSPAGEGASR